MVPFYPARDGYPSLFDPEDVAAGGATKLHRSFVDRLFADRLPAPDRQGRGDSRTPSHRGSER